MAFKRILDGIQYRFWTQPLVRKRFAQLSKTLESGESLFFIGGRQKTGTTWMQALCNHHPQLYCYAESQIFHRDWVPTLMQPGHASDYPFVGDYEIIRDKQHQAYRTALLSELRDNCNKPSAQKFGNKAPDMDMEVVLEIFPKARCLVMLRDFRDAMVSFAFHRNRTKGDWRGQFTDETLTHLDNTLLERYLKFQNDADDLGTYQRLVKASPERVRFVRYEDLLSQPEETLSSVFAFLGVGHETSVVAHSIAQSTFKKMSGGRSAGESDPKSFFRSGKSGEWKKHFSQENITTFKQLSGEALIQAGYEQNNDW